MTIKEFEKKIQKEIHPDLTVVPHPTNLDMAGVYFRGAFFCGMPSRNIYPEKNPNYTDDFSNPHATIGETESKIRGFMSQLKADDTLYDLMMKPYEKL